MPPYHAATITPPNSVMNGTRAPSHGSSSSRRPIAAATASSATRYRMFPPLGPGNGTESGLACRACRCFYYKPVPQARALAHELSLDQVDGDRAYRDHLLDGERGANTRGLAGGHDDRHDAVGAMGLVRAGNAAPGDDDALGMLRQQAAQRNVVGLPGRHALQQRAAALGIMDVDRVGAARDGIVELARAEDVVGRELVFAEHAPRLAHADLHAALHHVGILETRHVAAQEGGDLAHLAPAAPLRVGQVPDIRAEHARHARAVDAHLGL